MLSGKQVQSRELTPSHEHYLRAIWAVRSERGYARLSDVARELEISNATLSVGLKPLEQRELLSHDDRRFLVLTPSGERVAREVHHRFQVARMFLHDVLGVDEAQADAEACRLEHDLSGQTVERLLDLIKLLREDRELREFFQRRYTEYHRQCRPTTECATCDLACMGTPGPGIA
ncbi:MAG: metal-dependent transcriptional regulator [Candidatus Eisenbacteria bacterium]|uniref:Metal-dependent transcriptional regulator n=1 Tax=Eiseniibacteriota bacterium TaxID=2212470 RepID=A0A849SLN0_UNCEI|nr:metal-dependent transcriptional regulator [Candidatus Eisenbacteria bacterium]